MNAVSHFSDALWSEDICSTLGVEVVIKRMKDGYTVCKNIANYLRQRGKAECDYALSLQKIVKSTDFSSELGTLHDSLETVKQSLLQMVEEHQLAGREMYECAERLQTFSERQKAERSKEAQAVARIADKKKKCYHDCLNAKKVYHQAALEAEKTEEEVTKSKPMMNSMPTKEWEKIYNANTKAKRDSQKADDNYKRSVRVLEDTRHQWEKDVERFFDYCERQEIDRIRTVQNEIWCHSNITSATCVTDDQNCEEMRASLEQIDPEGDVQLFAQDNFIGSQKPASIVYEPYISANQTSTTAALDNNSNNQSVGSGSLPTRANKTLFPQHSVSSSATNGKNKNNNSKMDCEYADIEPYSCTKQPGGIILPQKPNIPHLPSPKISGSKTDLRDVSSSQSHVPSISASNGNLESISNSNRALYSPVVKRKPAAVPVKTSSVDGGKGSNANPIDFSSDLTSSAGNSKLHFSAGSPPLKPVKQTEATQAKRPPLNALFKTGKS